MLVVAIVLHQIFDRVNLKVHQYPLRRIFLRCVEFYGRICCFPLVTYLYTSTVGEISPNSHLLMMIITAAIVGLILSQE